MDDCGHPLSEDMLTTFGIHPKLKSWPIWLLFPYFCVVMSWQNCRRLPSMRESSCLGGHGTYLQCRNTTRPLAEEMCLKSSDFDDVRSLHTVPTHSTPTLSYFSCLCLSFSLLFACLSYAITQSLSEPLSLQHFSLSICLSHTLPHMVMLLLAKLVWWLIWVGVFVCVSLASVLTFTITRLLFAEDEPRLTPWRQRTSARNKGKNGFITTAWQCSATVKPRSP